MNKIQEFLSKNSITPSSRLPVVHTTSAYRLPDLLDAGEIKARECNVFIGESLNYFFYAKPSYKIQSNGNDATEWQLPVCFVVNIDAIRTIKRIYPFDTGAFKSKRHPGYITMMDIEAFNAGNFADQPSRILGAFFSSVDNLFKLRPKSKEDMISEFSLRVTDAEVFALQKLAGDSSHVGIDDRRFCIEIQTEDDIPLTNGSTLAIILPEEYLEDEQIRNLITNTLRALPIPYSITSMSSEAMTAVVYDKLLQYYKNEGFI